MDLDKESTGVEGEEDDQESVSNAEPRQSRREERLSENEQRAERKKRRLVARLNTARDLEVPPKLRTPAVEPRFFEIQMARLPQFRKRRSYSTLISFALFVLLPTVVGGAYFVFYASDQYAAEFKFAVSDSGSSTPVSTQSVIAAAIGGGAAATPTSTSNYMVTDYVQSQQAIAELQARVNVVARYSKTSIDLLSRFDKREPPERFLGYWRKMVRADYDQVTGLAVVEVRAFSADDAFQIANTLVAMSEELVNDIARRPLLEAVRVAEREANRTEDSLKKVRAAMTDFRNKQAVIDPTASLVTSNSLLVQSLNQSITQTQTELDGLVAQKVAANSPIYQMLQTRLASMQKQLGVVQNQVSNRGKDSALSSITGQYEQLELEQQFASTSLTGAMANLDAARANLVSQRMFITPYVRPVRPVSAIYPRRWLSAGAIAAVAFMLWASALLIMRSLSDGRYSMVE